MSADEKTEIERQLSVLRMIDRLCEEFEYQREAGAPIEIADFLPRVGPELQHELFGALMRSEVLGLCGQGCRPQAADYLRKFPEQADLIHTVFAEIRVHFPELGANAALPSDPVASAFEQRFVRHFRLGSGGQGEVWLARDRELDRFVAVKLIKESERNSRESLARFWREAHVTSKLEHPNIVPVYEAGRMDEGPGAGTPYYAMRVYGNRHLLRAFAAYHARPREPRDRRLLEAMVAFHNERTPYHEEQLRSLSASFPFDETYSCDSELRSAVTSLFEDRDSSAGRTLREAITACHARGTPVPEFRELLACFIDVCHALAYAHSRGVIHRDLKPENVMLGEFGETLVVDWGLAKVIGTSGSNEGAPGVATVRIPRDIIEVDSATRVGDVNGTLQYVSPEQASGLVDELTPASDIYSLGAILYVILTGRPLRLGDSWRVIHDAAKEGRVVAPSAVRPAVPRALEAVCLKAVSKIPSERYGSASDLAADVGRWLADQPVSAWREPLSTRARRWVRQHPAWIAATCAGVLAAGVFSAAYSMRQRQLVKDLQTEVRERQRQTALSDWNLARRFCEDGDVARGMLGMAKVLASLPEGDHVADLQQALRLELAGWRRHAPALVQVWEHPSAVTCLTVSSAGDVVATGCADGSVRLWEVGTGQLRSTFQGHESDVSALVFTPDGTELYSAGVDGTVFQWTLGTDERVEFASLSGDLLALALSPDSRWLLAGGAKGVARLWNTADRTYRDLSSSNSVRTVGFSPTAPLCFTGGGDQERGALFLHDLENLNAAPRQLRNPSDNQFAKSVRSAAFSSDGQLLLVGDEDWNATLWSVDTGEQLATTDYAQGEIVSAAISADGRSALLAAEYSQQALLWNLEGVLDQVQRARDGAVRLSIDLPREPMHSSMLHPAAVTAAAFVGTGDEMFLTACADGNVRIWKPAPGSDVIILPHHPRVRDRENSMEPVYVVRTVAVHPEGEMVATGGWDGSIQLWRLADGVRLGPPLIPEDPSPIMSIAFSPDGRSLAAGSKDGLIRLWDLDARTCTVQIPHHTEIVSGLSISLDGGWLLAGGAGQAILWDAVIYQPTGIQLPHSTGDASIATAISPDGNRLLTAGEDGVAKLWDREGHLVVELPHEMRVWNGQFSSDGLQVLTASDDESVRIWDARDGRMIAALQQNCSVFQAVFLLSEPLIVTASRDGGQIWDARLRRRLGAPCRHQAEAVDVAVSPDGATAVFADWDGFGVLWRLPQPVTGTPQEINAWIEATVGMRLDDAGSAVALEAAEWRSRSESVVD